MVYKLDEEIVKKIREEFKKLKREVNVFLFTADKDTCLYCGDLENLLDQLSEISPKIKVTKGLGTDTNEARKFRIDKHPAMVIETKKGKIRYFGVPSGRELKPFVETLVDVSTGEPKLNPKTIKRVSKISSPTNIQIFTTPTCPFCPDMVRVINRLAVINENITSDFIDSMEFPNIGHKYQVFSVPRVVINDIVNIDGNQTEEAIVNKLIEAKYMPEY